MHKLGPLLADSFVMNTVGVKLNEYRNIIDAEVKKNKFEMLSFMHHLTSGLKSIYSQMAYDSIDLIRTNCGGAGYSAWSGLTQ